jgi:RNA polymerase sigma-70 factor, ECF subfamily
MKIRETDDAGIERRERRPRWMALAQEGDHEAYRALLEDISVELRRFIRRRIRDEHESEDICQEVLLTMHRARHTYDPSRPFEPWLYAVARNVVIDHERGRQARTKWEALVEELPERASPASELLGETRLDEALKALPQGQRNVIEMLKVEGLSVESAARRARISPGALRVRAHRAYRALRALLGSVD